MHLQHYLRPQAKEKVNQQRFARVHLVNNLTTILSLC